VDDGPRAIRLAFRWALPSIYWPWEPLLIHGTKGRYWVAIPVHRPSAKVDAARKLQRTAVVFAG
jgi:hypothetical protein